MKKYVNRNQEKNLPKANLISIRISKFWFRQFWKWIKKDVNEYRYIAPYPKFFIRTRGANFTSIYLGPINITLRSKWLYFSAFALHKDKLT